MTAHQQYFNVAGHCPACGREQLGLDEAGFIVCLAAGCPRVFAASDILADSETGHVVQLDADDFTVRHPLRERLDDALMSCELDRWVAGLAGPPHPLGRYRVTGSGESWTWEAIRG